MSMHCAKVFQWQQVYPFMEDFTLHTAENVPVHYDIATVGSRSAALLVDFFYNHNDFNRI
jgi:hypothetical protein